MYSTYTTVVLVPSTLSISDTLGRAYYTGVPISECSHLAGLTVVYMYMYDLMSPMLKFQ